MRHLVFAPFATLIASAAAATSLAAFAARGGQRPWRQLGHLRGQRSGQRRGRSAPADCSATPAPSSKSRRCAGPPGNRPRASEVFYKPQIAFGLGYDASTAASERADFTDRSQAVSAEVIYYPLGLGRYPVFGAAGVRLEQAELGRQRLRDTTTWSRTNANEVNDTWVNDDTYYSWTQTIGYRAFASRWVTASLRVMRDELLMTQSSASAKDVVTPNA